MKPSNQGYLAVFSLLLAATFWGVIWYPLRLLEVRGLVGLWATLAMYLTPLVLLSIPLLIKSRKWMRTAPLSLILLSIAAGWTNMAFILAVIEGPVVRVMLLFYLSPIWAVLLGYFILGESVHRQQIPVILLAMVGAFVMLWRPGIGLPIPTSDNEWLAISAGVAFSLNNVMGRKLHAMPLAPKIMVSWIGVVLLSVGTIVVTSEPIPDISLETAGYAAALGIFGIAVITSSVLYGLSHMPVSRSSVIMLFELVAGSVSAALLTSEVILPQEWLGGAFILLSALLSARQQR